MCGSLPFHEKTKERMRSSSHPFLLVFLKGMGSVTIKGIDDPVAESFEVRVAVGDPQYLFDQ